MPPVISIIGKSETGKTTLVVKLVKELKSRGYRVATVKHTPQEVTFDQPDKDSWRHIEAGSEATVISGRDRMALVKPLKRSLSLEQIVHNIGEDYDIVLAEGFKQGNAPKIEVHRKEIGPPLTNIRKLIAIVTDEPLPTRARQFSSGDTSGLVDLLEEGFIKPQRERIVLYVNNSPVILTSFPKKLIRNTLLGMVSSLKGVEPVKSLEVRLREKPEPPMD